MKTALIFFLRLLDGRYHARVERGREPEWPPAPIRLFQAIVAGVAPRWHDAAVRDRERPALLWLENQPPPTIVTPASHQAAPLLTYVPNNNDPSVNERTAKTIAPTILHDDDRLIEWRYSIDLTDKEAAHHAATLTRTVRHVTHLGWGIDLAVGHATVGEPAEIIDQAPDRRVTHLPSTTSFTGGTILRAPTSGTLESLEKVHQGKLDRFATPGVLTLRNDQPAFAEVSYTSSLRRNFIAFRLVDESDEDVSYSTDHIKHIAGTLRNLAATVCVGQFDKAIINGTINGHPQDAPRLSILPLPSIGHRHVDGRVRRVIFAEPIGGDGTLCRHLARVLDQHEVAFHGDCPCPPAKLVALPRGDAVLERYTRSATTWASATPVLLPGHNQRKRDGQAKAIERACKLVAISLQQAGIDTRAAFEINRLPYWPGTRHARDYAPRDKLQHCPRFHVKLTFAQPVTGPLAIGAGRHVGFGTLAALSEGE